MYQDGIAVFLRQDWEVHQINYIKILTIDTVLLAAPSSYETCIGSTGVDLPSLKSCFVSGSGQYRLI